MCTPQILYVCRCAAEVGVRLIEPLCTHGLLHVCAKMAVMAVPKLCHLCTCVDVPKGFARTMYPLAHLCMCHNGGVRGGGLTH